MNKNEVEINPEFINIGPFRFVKPYRFTYTTDLKKGKNKRWIGKTILEALSEFKSYSIEELKDNINKGTIKVNNKIVDTNYIIQKNDKIENSLSNKIEAPIYNEEIIKIGETDEFIAYCKPCSIPINMSSGYFFNSFYYIKNKIYRIVHRLDKQTSGVLILAKTLEAAKKFQRMMEVENHIYKTYLARVTGEFPGGEVVEKGPIGQSVENRTKYCVCEHGKPSETRFKLLWTDGNESLVECKPLTGRTHQIRVHLSYLGFPIIGDTLYKGRELKLTDEENQAIQDAKKLGLWPPQCELDPDHPCFRICLHSLIYKTELFEFIAPYPSWAKELDHVS